MRAVMRPKRQPTVRPPMAMVKKEVTPSTMSMATISSPAWVMPRWNMGIFNV